MDSRFHKYKKCDLLPIKRIEIHCPQNIKVNCNGQSGFHPRLARLERRCSVGRAINWGLKGCISQL